MEKYVFGSRPDPTIALSPNVQPVGKTLGPGALSQIRPSPQIVVDKVSRQATDVTPGRTVSHGASGSQVAQRLSRKRQRLRPTIQHLQACPKLRSRAPRHPSIPRASGSVTPSARKKAKARRRPPREQGLKSTGAPQAPEKGNLEQYVHRTHTHK